MEKYKFPSPDSQSDFRIVCYPHFTEFVSPQKSDGPPDWVERELVDLFTGEVVKSLHSIKTRGRIKEFSRKSRVRLMKRIFSLDQLPPWFLTLTYPRFYPADSSEWKRHMMLLNRRIIRRFPNCWWYWKLEPQQRGAPHYHLIGDFGQAVDKKTVIQWVSETWAEIVAGGSVWYQDSLKAGTQCKYLSNGTGKDELKRYISKYCAKSVSDKYEEWANPGKYWGYINKGNIPVSHYVIHYMRPEAFNEIKKCVCKWLKKIAPDYGKVFSKWQSAFVFMENEKVIELIKKFYGFYSGYLMQGQGDFVSFLDNRGSKFVFQVCSSNFLESFNHWRENHQFDWGWSA